nr:type III pantothenate kinase [Lentibacillus sp. JNUCC-1]
MVDVIFVVDVGNTNTVLGVFEQNHLKYEWRIKTDRHQTEDELGILIESLLNHRQIKPADIKGIVISSVVPPIMFALEKMCRLYFDIEPLVIGKADFSSIIKMTYPNPQEIGADRIVNAKAALAEYEPPLIIIDFGTATTFCYIDEKAQYTGGLIAPGVNVSLEALYQKAAKLPKIEIQTPERVVGTSTVSAMQSGVYWGYVGQVDGIVTRMKQEASQTPTVIATGGLARLISHGSETIQHVDKHLTLKGLNMIYHQLHKGASL